MTTPQRFPQEMTSDTESGPNFPGSSGDRERGRFRPSVTPRRTTVAVAGDDGEALTRNTDALLRELLLWQKAALIGFVYQAQGMTLSVNELLAEAKSY